MKYGASIALSGFAVPITTDELTHICALGVKDDT